MTSGGRTSDQSRVLLAVERKANRDQLAAWLSERYDVETVGDGPVRGALERCDLCIVDSASFHHYRSELAANKVSAEPLFLPYLLLLTGQALGDTRNDAWETVDDVIGTPIRQAELRGRIEVLLRARRYAVDLDRQNRRLERFAEIVSHELRNPLGVAQGFLDTARTSGDPDAFDRVEGALDRMDEIVDDVLSLARTGTVADESESIDVADVAGTAWRTVATGAAALDVDIDGPAVVRGDETRVRELFENLFRNAIEHGSACSRTQSRGGEDGVEPPGTDVTVRVGVLEGGGGFYVADDGPGIPAAERDGVFEYGHTTADEGTGFGLAIVRKIVEAHDWTIGVTESVKRGARFEIECDVRSGTASAPDSAGNGGDRG